MDAKVLRAAVSAAIRVTVSTTLVGCGNTASNEAALTETGGHASSAQGGDHTATGGVPNSAAGATLETAGSAPSGGVGPMISSGGQPSPMAPEVAGSTSTAGETSGSAGEAGAPSQVCGAKVLDCVSMLEGIERGATLDEAGDACCVEVRAGLFELQQSGAECYIELGRRFQATAARQACCKDPSTWSETACTPWGPPVPPEFSADLPHIMAAVA